MTRGVALYLAGSVVLLTLAGCGRSWFAEREAWRREAELACLKSGAVREGPSIATLRPIDGPGVCGADFPLSVSALGTTQVLGFADDPRPPGLIPQSPAVGPPLGPPLGASDAPYAPSMRARDQPGPAMAIDPPNDPIATEPPSRLVPRRFERDQGGSHRSVLPSQPPFSPVRGLPVTAGPAVITPAATLACPVVSALDNWIANGIEPAALRWFGQPVVEIKQISAYSCRSMNGQRGAPISEHAFGNALDVAAFTFADGRKVTVRDGWGGPPAERGFLHDAQTSACQQFSTVLAPGSNVFHYDHIHVDLARHASGRTICKPAPIPGEVIARGFETPITGGLGTPRAHRVGPRFGETPTDDDHGLPDD